MDVKYAVALLSRGVEKILGIFDTKEDADRFGNSNKIDKSEGLQYCFSAPFVNDTPMGDFYNVYDYYNVDIAALA